MNKRNHFIFAILSFIPIWFISKDITISVSLLGIFWSALVPDTDHLFKRHRDIIFHTILIPLIIYLFNIGNPMGVAILYGHGVHLLGDCKWWKVKINMDGKKYYNRKGGTWCIMYNPFTRKRLSNLYTRLIFLSNFGIALTILILEVIY